MNTSPPPLHLRFALLILLAGTLLLPCPPRLAAQTGQRTPPPPAPPQLFATESDKEPEFFRQGTPPQTPAPAPARTAAPEAAGALHVSPDYRVRVDAAHDGPGWMGHPFVVTHDIIGLYYVDGKSTPATFRNPSESIAVRPLDIHRASNPSSYTLVSTDDEAYRNQRTPTGIGRMSKGREWVSQPGGQHPHLTEHWLFLKLPQPMQAGKTYTIAFGDLFGGHPPLSLTYDPTQTRCEAIKVNQFGYQTGAARKIAYLTQWMGDLGPLDASAWKDAPFSILDVRDGQTVFTGTIALRKPLSGGSPDTLQANEMPHQNYAGADLWEMDFSAFNTPGHYVISVEGLGASFPFAIGDTVYREPFLATLRSLYHQRSGIALEPEYTPFSRPVSLSPDRFPMQQTTHRNMDKAYSEGYDKADSLRTGEVRAIWGGWHDAGDWDQEAGHFNVPHFLLLAWELSPEKFTDGQSRIPESGNGIPDIIDEAAFGVDFWHRLQRPDGGVSLGRFASTYPRAGETSWDNPMKWYLYAEEPKATFEFAAAAARLAWVYHQLGHRDKANAYLAPARKAYAWAQRHTEAKEENKVRDARQHAAAMLFRITGEKHLHDTFRNDLRVRDASAPLTVWGEYDQQLAVWTYAMTQRPEVDPALQSTLREAAIAYARKEFVASADQRGFRVAYSLYMPFFWGRGTTPQLLPLMVAHTLTGDNDFLSAIQTSADYFLGGNPLNMVWITGIGHRSPEQIMDLDSWSSPWYGELGIRAGLVPEGPHRYEGRPDSGGPWDPHFVMRSAYPPAKAWPTPMLWFENRKCAPINEFHLQLLAEAAVAYGYLQPPAKDTKSDTPPHPASPPSP